MAALFCISCGCELPVLEYKGVSKLCYECYDKFKDLEEIENKYCGCCGKDKVPTKIHLLKSTSYAVYCSDTCRKKRKDKLLKKLDIEMRGKEDNYETRAIKRGIIRAMVCFSCRDVFYVLESFCRTSLTNIRNKINEYNIICDDCLHNFINIDIVRESGSLNYCLNCGRSYNVKYKNNLFCSNRCYDQYKRLGYLYQLKKMAKLENKIFDKAILEKKTLSKKIADKNDEYFEKRIFNMSAYTFPCPWENGMITDWCCLGIDPVLGF